MREPNSLVIRKAQLLALGAARAEPFVQRLAEHVAAVFPDQAGMVRGPDGRALIESIVDRARAYRLSDERSIALFADLCFGLGQDFDARPECVWIKDILVTEDLGGAGRMYLVYKQLPERCPGPPVAAAGTRKER